MSACRNCRVDIIDCNEFRNVRHLNFIDLFGNIGFRSKTIEVRRRRKVCNILLYDNFIIGSVGTISLILCIVHSLSSKSESGSNVVGRALRISLYPNFIITIAVIYTDKRFLSCVFIGKHRSAAGRFVPDHRCNIFSVLLSYNCVFCRGRRGITLKPI